MNDNKTVVEITYNSRGLSEILVGDISLDIQAIRGKNIQEWFDPFKGRISWKGLIPEIKEALQDSDAEFDFVFLGRPEYRKIFEECLEKSGLYGKQSDLQENSQVETGSGEEKYLHSSRLEEIRRKAKRLENLGDKKESLVRYSILAQQGDAEAQYKTAELRKEFLEEGNEKHTENERYQIFILYESAAKQGHTEAMRCLADCYRDGVGVDEDPKEAAVWYEKAADAGDIVSMRNIGICYEEGYGVEKDEKVAAQWYKKAITKNDAEAGFKLGCLYLFGEDIDEDMEEAQTYLKKSAELGNPIAQYMYAMVTDKGDAVEWLIKSVEQDFADAQYILGERYLIGDGVPKDEDKAVELFQKSADQENEDAQCGGLDYAIFGGLYSMRTCVSRRAGYYS